jgi:hypothetical protein
LTERQEQAEKALRRAWRVFTEAVNKMGNVTLHADLRESTKGEDIVAFSFSAHAEITE